NLIDWLSELDFSKTAQTITPFVNALENIVAIGVEIGRSLGSAIMDVFPPASATTIQNIGSALERFTHNIKEVLTSSDGLQRTFRGVISIFGIAWEVVKGLALMFGELLGFSTNALGGVLDFTGGIGDFIYNLHQA